MQGMKRKYSGVHLPQRHYDIYNVRKEELNEMHEKMKEGMNDMDGWRGELSVE